MQEADFLNGDVNNDGDGKLTEDDSNAGGDYDDGTGDDGKRKVDCDGQVDHDGDDNNGGVDDGCDVDINDGNDFNGDDGMSKTNRDDDADGGSGNSHNDGGVDGNGAFDVKGGDEADDCDEQTESVAGHLAKCNRCSEMEMKVVVM